MSFETADGHERSVMVIRMVFEAYVPIFKTVEDRWVTDEALRIGLNKKEYLSTLRSDWWHALNFFLHRVFFRGRSDVVSRKFLDKTIMVLRGMRGDAPKLDGRALDAALKDAGVNNSKDRKMVIGAIQFAGRLPKYDFNIVDYVISEHERGGALKEVLESLKDIPGVGDKTASMFLRDLFYHFRTSDLTQEECSLLQPIDVHVRRVALRTGLVFEYLRHKLGCTPSQAAALLSEVGDMPIKLSISYFSTVADVSPLEVNGGLWVVGKIACKPLKFDKLIPKGKSCVHNMSTLEKEYGIDEPPFHERRCLLHRFCPLYHVSKALELE
ncbi:hypothetical protein [Candidatus Alkanophaga liquidiphilum]